MLGIPPSGGMCRSASGPGAPMAPTTGYNRCMSQAERSSPIQVASIPEEDRSWLRDQVERYKALLTYLREH